MVKIGGEDKELRVVEAGVSGDLAWCLAQYSDGQDLGTSLNVFQRQADGRWLIRICSLNSLEYSLTSCPKNRQQATKLPAASWQR